MLDEQTFIITVYCQIDDIYWPLFPEGVRSRGFSPQLTDVEALTIGIVGEYLALDGDKAIFEYFYKHYREWFPALRERTHLVRQWNNLWQVKKSIWQQLVHQSGAYRADFQVIDTLPIPICSLKRYKLRNILVDDLLLQPDVGYCASKDFFYFGFKGAIRIAANGMIVHANLLPARAHDITLTDQLLAGCPAGTTVLADKAFLSYQMQTDLKQEHALELLTPLKKGMQSSFLTLPKIARPIRQLIETVNGQLVERFHIQKMRVRKGWTLLAKWYRKILSHTIFVYLNIQSGRDPLDFDGLVQPA